MPETLEELALSGRLFENHTSLSRPRTPESLSPTPDTDDELFGSEPSSSSHRISFEDDPNASSRARAQPQQEQTESIGMGPGRTGVKGVIRDRAEARERERTRNDRARAELKERMARMNLGGNRTYADDEKDRRRAKRREDGLDSNGSSDDGEENEKAQSQPKGRFWKVQGTMDASSMEGYGHLREVGADGYINAIEKVDRDVYVVAHIYMPTIERCIEIDNELSKLARLNVRTSFLRVRADAIGFASRSRGANAAGRARRSSEEHDEDGEDEYDGTREYGVDEDMLPTLLVYKAGELEFNWVRVDWEAGRAGLSDLLVRNKVIERGLAPDGEADGLDDEFYW